MCIQLIISVRVLRQNLHLVLFCGYINIHWWNDRWCNSVWHFGWHVLAVLGCYNTKGDCCNGKGIRPIDTAVEGYFVPKIKWPSVQTIQRHGWYAIVNIYGDFSQFTMPIITQSMLRDFDIVFQQMLPVQYHANQIMIGKPPWLIPDAPLTDEQRQKEQLWDCYTLFEFIHQSHIQNSHKFILFAVVNAAALYGSTRSHIPIYFG